MKGAALATSPRRRQPGSSAHYRGAIASDGTRRRGSQPSIARGIAAEKDELDLKSGRPGVRGGERAGR
eukprot:720441-Pyramimonas_sp.AAC.1